MSVLKSKKTWIVVLLMALGVSIHEAFLVVGFILWLFFASKAQDIKKSRDDDDSYDAKTGAGFQYGTGDTSGSNPTSFY